MQQLKIGNAAIIIENAAIKNRQCSNKNGKITGNAAINNRECSNK